MTNQQPLPCNDTAPAISASCADAAEVIKKLCAFIVSFGYVHARAAFSGDHGIGNLNVSFVPYSSRGGGEAVVSYDSAKHACLKNATPEQARATYRAFNNFRNALSDLLPDDWSADQGSHGLIEISLVPRTIKVGVTTRIYREEKTEYGFQ